MMSKYTLMNVRIRKFNGRKLFRADYMYTTKEEAKKAAERIKAKTYVRKEKNILCIDHKKRDGYLVFRHWRSLGEDYTIPFKAHPTWSR